VIVYGRNAVRELLRARRRPVRRVWATRSVEGAPAPVSVVSAEELERICGSAGHQGICAETTPYEYESGEDLLAVPDPLIVALDEIQDPQNLGAICRSAECAGATGVVVPSRGAALVTGAVSRASAGAVEHLAVARVTNLANYLRDAKQAGAWVYGAEAGAEQAYTQPDYSGRLVFVLGSEGKGLRPRVRDSCDALVSLPVRGRIASLNVSAAAAALLYEVVRQRADASAG